MAPEDSTLTTLRWFVFRARRVAEHSLVMDRDRLLAWASGTVQFTWVDGWPHSLSASLPEEEPFESLAGRVRPFLMPGDDLYFKKVLAALRTYLSEDAERTAAVDHVEERWSRFDPKSGETLGYAARVGKDDGPLGALVADTTLADAWLYCDFGHGDTNVVKRVGAHDLDDRFFAAVLLITSIAVCTVMALNIIIDAWRAGLLPLNDSEFTDAVLARTEMSHPIAAAASGPVGTPMEVLEKALDQARAGTDQRDRP